MVRAKGRDDRDADGPETLPIQPMPVTCRVATLAVRGAVVSAIQRSWGAGPIRGRCRLCPATECNFDTADRSCLLIVEGVVTDADAWLFGTARARGLAGRPAQDAGLAHGGGTLR